jgi:hypothetical protein
MKATFFVATSPVACCLWLLNAYAAHLTASSLKANTTLSLPKLNYTPVTLTKMEMIMKFIWLLRRKELTL